MKIVNAIIKNYKAIHCVEITPSGNMTIISGQNSSGKSSCIEALVTTLAGKEKGKDVPVRTGSDGAIVEIDLGDRIVKRVIKGDRDELEVYTKEGHTVKRPRSVLDELMDKRKFNVMTFVTGRPKEQRALLMELAGLSFGQLDVKKSVIYNERTLIGREKESLKGQVDGLPHDDEAPKAPVDTKEIIAQINENNEFNNKIAAQKASYQSNIDKRDMLKMEVKQVQERLAMLEKQLSDVNTLISNVPETATPKDNTPLETKLAGAEEANNKFRQNEKRTEVYKRYQDKCDEYKAKTEEYEKLEAGKIEALKDAKFPIPGLSIDDDSVTYNDVPLDDESLSNKLKIGLAIAMSLPTELKTIILDDAETLDDENMKVVEKMVSDKGYQAIIARRSESAENVITIKDGTVCN